MRNFQLALIILAILIVSGCKSTEQEQIEIADKDDKECLSFGAAKGSPQYIDCRLKLKSIRQSEVNARRMSPNSTCTTSFGVTNCF